MQCMHAMSELQCRCAVSIHVEILYIWSKGM